MWVRVGQCLRSAAVTWLSDSHHLAFSNRSTPFPTACEAPDQTSGSPYSDTSFLPLGVKGQTEIVKMMRLEDEGWGYTQPRGCSYLAESIKNIKKMKSECAKNIKSEQHELLTGLSFISP